VPAGEYRALLTDIKARIRMAQIKASLSVNRELIQLHWDIGGLIVGRQRAKGWGNSVVEKLALDIQKEFPGIEEFSPRNVWRMRAFYVAWVPSEPMPLAFGKNRRKRLPRAVADLDSRFLPQAVPEIPWGHNIILLEKRTNTDQRLGIRTAQSSDAGRSGALHDEARRISSRRIPGHTSQPQRNRGGASIPAVETAVVLRPTVAGWV
jgi:predicted nuclease of restriction endonuclease-like (RecB) superfamily